MEFQAIVMAAGKGSRMMELTISMPKCLLPLGNVPVIFSTLHMLKEASIHDVIIIVLETDKSKIQDAVNGKFDFKLDIVSIPKNEDWGTADSLRFIKEKIVKDVIVLSCDLVTDFNLLKMIHLHRIHDSSLTMLLTPWFKSLKDTAIPGHKGKHKLEKDIIGIDDERRLMFVYSDSDLENGLPLKMSVLFKHPRIHVHSDLMDTHVYIMKKFIVEFIVNNKQLSTLKGEFLPVIISKQFCPNKNVSAAESDTLLTDKEPSKCEPGNYKESIDLKKLALELSSWNNHTGTFDECYCGDDLKCFAFVDKDAFCIRTNTLVGYLEANKQIAKRYASVTGSEPKLHTYQKSQVDNDSVIGKDCELLAKSSVKQSIIKNNCSLKEKVKIVNCVLMDNVKIEHNSSIQGSIIFSNVKIGTNCEIKNCVIGPDQTIEDSTKLSNEVLQGAYNIMEI